MILILDNLRGAENVGSIFRTADAAGLGNVDAKTGAKAGEIILVGTTPAPIDRFGRPNPKIAKAALGAEKTIHWSYSNTIAPVINRLKKNGYEVLALEQHQGSTNFRWVKLAKKWALIVGNEVDGVASSTLKKCDTIIEIPMRGNKESLNVSVATGIALFELFK